MSPASLLPHSWSLYSIILTWTCLQTCSIYIHSYICKYVKFLFAFVSLKPVSGYRKFWLLLSFCHPQNVRNTECFFSFKKYLQVKYQIRSKFSIIRHIRFLEEKQHSIFCQEILYKGGGVSNGGGKTELKMSKGNRSINANQKDPVLSDIRMYAAQLNSARCLWVFGRTQKLWLHSCVSRICEPSRCWRSFCLENEAYW